MFTIDVLPCNACLVALSCIELPVYIDSGGHVKRMILDHWGGLAALSHASRTTPNRYTELGPENPFIYSGTIDVDQGFFF